MNTLGRRAILQASAAVSLAGCCRPQMVPAGWSNEGGTEYVLPRWQWSPRSARELVEAVSRAGAEGHRVRMVGSGHSYSDVALTDDWLLDPTGLARPLELDRGTLCGEVDSSTLVRVASGLRIRELNKHLDARGLALENMGGWDIQTYVGAAMTGTHGSGLKFGPLASQIVSFQVVTGQGEILQVEPSKGISDPSRFPRPLLEDGTLKVTLCQNDALFQALAVSMGCLGVVYAVTFRAVKKFWLVERRTVKTWEELTGSDGLLTRMLAGRPMHPLVERDPDHVEVYLCTYARADKTHAALFTERWRTEQKPWGAGTMARNGTVAEDLGLLADELGLLEPFLAARSTDEVRSLQETALNTQATNYYANVSYRVFTTGPLNRLGVYGIEPAFDVKDTLEVATTFLRVAAALAAEGMHHSAPVSFRFGAAAPALLSMHQGRRTMNLEMALLRKYAHAEEMFRTYESLFVNGHLKARPHWGLDRNVLRSPAAVARLYPDTFPAWLDARGELDPQGLFDGRFTDRVGISRRLG